MTAMSDREPSLVQPFPALPIADGFDYLLAFTVPATTRLEAVSEAVNRMRTGLSLNGVFSVDPKLNGFWEVVLHVHESV